MIRIGITGGIGSGKSTVCRVFENLGVPIFYADVVAKEIMVSDPLLVEGVQSAFGKESYDMAGRLNNKHIAGIVFNDSSKLAVLNALVHPAVFRAFDQWESAAASKAPYLIKEAALLFESGSYQACDKSILVTAPLEMRLQRVISRDKVSADQVLSRMDKQMSEEDKANMADFQIRNDETESVIQQVMDLHLRFLNTTR